MSPDHPTARSAQANYPTTYPKAFWVALVIGWTMIGFGVRGLLINADSPMPTEPVHWATLFVKAGILNDLLVLPIVFVFGRLIAQVVSPRVRAPVQGGLICAAIVTAFAYPSVRGFGLNSGNPTILPRNYGIGLAIVLALISAVTAVITLVAWRRSAQLSVE